MKKEEKKDEKSIPKSLFEVVSQMVSFVDQLDQKKKEQQNRKDS
jgi:type III secretion system FlhB-like substrate exporter